MWKEKNRCPMWFFKWMLWICFQEFTSLVNYYVHVACKLQGAFKIKTLEFLHLIFKFYSNILLIFIDKVLAHYLCSFLNNSKLFIFTLELWFPINAWTKKNDWCNVLVVAFSQDLTNPLKPWAYFWILVSNPNQW